MMTATHRSLMIAPVLLALATSLPAPASAQQTLPKPVQATVAPESEYVIGPGDLLEILVWDNTTITRTVPVRPDGKISLPLLNDVTAAGMTTKQLSEFLNQALAKYVATPEVTVIVREVHSFRVSVLGQVKTPGTFELRSHPTVLEALAMAGGLNEFADAGRIVVLRREGTRSRTIPFAYNKLVSRNGSGGTQDNFLLKPDDVVLVR